MTNLSMSQAYESAKLIQDEAKRAEAMLDIIKEIDYFPLVFDGS